MTHWAMLTLDLSNASEKQRTTFYAELSGMNWHKLPRLTTTWRGKFVDKSEAESVRITKANVAKAKQVSGVTKVEAAVEIGPNQPVEF